MENGPPSTAFHLPPNAATPAKAGGLAEAEAVWDGGASCESETAGGAGVVPSRAATQIRYGIPPATSDLWPDFAHRVAGVVGRNCGVGPAHRSACHPLPRAGPDPRSCAGASLPSQPFLNCFAFPWFRFFFYNQTAERSQIWGSVSVFADGMKME